MTYGLDYIIHLWFQHPAAAGPAFAIEKAKTAKDVLDKKALAAAGTAAPALQFLRAEKRKDVYATNLTYLQLLASRLQSKKRKWLRMY